MSIRGRKHQKRVAAPRTWPILRKTTKFVVKSMPGPHNKINSISLITVLKEMLEIAKTTKEATKIISNKEILVNGNIVKKGKFPIGFMDIVSIPKLKKSFRMLLNEFGKLQLYETKTSDFILSRIADKTILKKGQIQLNLEDGRNMIVKKNTYHTGDVLKLKIPGQEIVDHFELKKGNIVYITSGKHAGEVGEIKEITERKENTTSSVKVQSKKGEFKTVKKYAFVIGKDKPAITIGR
jgi:small subunit ribosomal protein S4e